MSELVATVLCVFVLGLLLTPPGARAGTSSVVAKTLRDRASAIAIRIPSGWEGRPMSLARAGRVVDRLVVSSDRLPETVPREPCRAAAWLRGNVADAAAVLWVRERLLPSRAHLRALPSRPSRIELAGVVASGCARGAHRWRFRAGGRSFVLLAFVGPSAGAGVRQSVASAIESLEIGPRAIGRSRQRRPIDLVAAGNPKAPMRVLVVGCIHGDECAASAVLRQLRRRPTRSVDLWLLPTLNPDGRAAGTRQNAAGVDLNRNFPGTWAGGGARGDRYYSGPRASSEPETRVGMAAIRRLRPNITIWFHQPETNVRAGGGSASAARTYADLVDLPYRALPVPRGAATAWQTSAYPGSQGFVVELPPGPLSRASAARHARAVRSLASELRP